MGLSRPLLGLLLVLTFLWLVPWAPQGPFDARTGAPVPWLTLESPLWTAAVEPLLAPGRMLAGAPDFRAAAIETTVWLVIGAAVAAGLRGRGWGRVRRAGFGAVAALLAAVVYVAALALVRVPLWRLAGDDPDLLIADLHSHTRVSHDGLVGARESLAWHRAQGYNVVAISEHRRADGGLRARELASAMPGAPGVIPGVEVRADQEEYLIGLGLCPSRPVLLEGGSAPDYIPRFVREVHEGHGGAVLAMSWFLTPALVRKLVAAGVDGFEIANTGHPDLSPELRQALLAAARDHHVLLVASTDWHGWGGATRTWTVARVPGAARMDPNQRAQTMVRLLREHSPLVTPVIAGAMGSPRPWRAVLAPITESIRYGAELSFPRVASWWVWALGLTVAARRLAARGMRPGRIGYAALLLAPATALGTAAWRLFSLRELSGAPHGFGHEIAGYGLGIAAVGGCVALVLLAREWLRRDRG